MYDIEDLDFEHIKLNNDYFLMFFYQLLQFMLQKSLINVYYSYFIEELTLEDVLSLYVEKQFLFLLFLFTP